MKKTVVDWLADEIIYLEERFRLKEINLNDFIEQKDKLVEEALIKQKEMMKESFYQGRKYERGEIESEDSYNKFTGFQKPNNVKGFEEFYKETYGKIE